ncbi:MAG: DNA polymerase III subunit gamma/tau [Candidatus Moranbacteria bacterium]|nr:DNA polymerase III subunit gamma/tau [Candidatus Moranbacteria bacterium]
MSTTFYRKYRPQKFSEVIGQKHIVTTLVNALKLGRVAQAYLFTGPRGTGKTTLARLFAKAINCSKRKGAEACGTCIHCLLVAEGRSFDIIEIDAASHTGVDNIRELRETVSLPPAVGSHKIYIIDEVHMLSIGAFNALLKTLEEPPAHVVFILATTALHKVPDTIISRCQRFDLSRFLVTSIVEKLSRIAKEEKLIISKEALEIIAFSAEGGMRDAESLLMQIVALGASPITEDTVTEVLGTTKKESVTALIRLIGENMLYPSLALVRKIAQSGADLSLFTGLILHFLRDLLLVNTNQEKGLALLGELTSEQKASLTELSALFTPIEIVTMLEHFQVAQGTTKTAVIPELPLEIAIVKILANSHEQPPAQKDLPLSATTEVASPLTAAPPKKEPSKTQSTIEGNNKQQAVTVSTEKEGRTNETKKALFDLSHIKTHWQAILDTAKRLNASITLGLSSARPIETDGSTIVIAVKYPFHKERLDEKVNQLTLEKAFDTILGAKMKLVIVLENTQNAASSPVADENPLINQALSILGGRVVNET